MRESRYTAEGVTHPLQPVIWEACDRLEGMLAGVALARRMMTALAPAPMEIVP